MTPKEIIDLEISLALLKYGKDTVLKAIARKLNVTDEVLRTELDQMLKVQLPLGIKKKKMSAHKSFDIGSVKTGDKQKDDYLIKLYTKFNNKTFLPELKDVNRIFDRHGKTVPKLKSRELAKPQLFKFLSELEVSILQKMHDNTPAHTNESALGLIADEILNRNNE